MGSPGPGIIGIPNDMGNPHMSVPNRRLLGRRGVVSPDENSSRVRDVWTPSLAAAVQDCGRADTRNFQSRGMSSSARPRASHYGLDRSNLMFMDGRVESFARDDLEVYYTRSRGSGNVPKGWRDRYYR